MPRTHRFTAKKDETPKWKSEAMSHGSKPGAGARKRKYLKGQKKVGVVLSEFKRGTLHSGSGQIIKKRSQAIAVALSEAGLSKKKRKKRKK